MLKRVHIIDAYIPTYFKIQNFTVDILFDNKLNLNTDTHLHTHTHSTTTKKLKGTTSNKIWYYI